MNRNRIVINDEDLDLSIDTIVAISKKGFNPVNIFERSNDFTNQFKVPYTENNNRIYQNLKSVNSRSSIPYRNQTCKIICNGIEIMSNGIAILKDATDGYGVYVVSSLGGFFNILKDGRKLTDLNLTSNDAPFSPDQVYVFRNTVDGVVAPVLNYGLWNGFDVDTFSQLPSWYYATIVAKIFNEAGYIPGGNIFSETKYSKKIIPFSRDKYEYDPTFAEPYKFSARSTGTQVFTAPQSTTYIVFDNIDISSAYFISDYIFLNSSPYGLYSHFYSALNFSTTGAPGITIQMLLNSDVIGEYVLQDSTWILDSKTLYPNGIRLAIGDQIRISIALTGTGSDTVSILADSIFSSEPLLKPNIESGDIAFGKLLPDMTQYDFMQDFIVTNGLFWRDDNYSSITFKSINEMIADRANAKDWTTKLVTRQKPISFSSDSYAQSNYFEYTNNDDKILNTYGRASLNVDNENLETAATIYKSPFGASLTSIVNSKLLSTIGVYEFTKQQFSTVDLISLAPQFAVGISGDVSDFFKVNQRVYYRSDNAVYNGFFTVSVIFYNDTLGRTYLTFLEEAYVSAATSGTVNRIPEKFDNTPGLRLLLVREPYSYETSVLYFDTNYGDALVAYFEDPNQSDNLVMQEYLDDNYSYLQDGLDKMKIVNAEYLLTETDVASFDFLVPIFDKDNYYLVSEIKDFVNGFATTVELFRL